jgi:hypothetical protein
LGVERIGAASASGAIGPADANARGADGASVSAFAFDAGERAILR